MLWNEMWHLCPMYIYMEQVLLANRWVQLGKRKEKLLVRINDKELNIGPKPQKNQIILSLRLTCVLDATVRHSATSTRSARTQSSWSKFPISSGQRNSRRIFLIDGSWSCLEYIRHQFLIDVVVETDCNPGSPWWRIRMGKGLTMSTTKSWMHLSMGCRNKESGSSSLPSRSRKRKVHSIGLCHARGRCLWARCWKRKSMLRNDSQLQLHTWLVRFLLSMSSSPRTTVTPFPEDAPPGAPADS